MTIDEAIETLRYEIDEECHCEYIADEIRFLIAEVERLQSGWISVNEKLPEENTRVLVYLGTKRTGAMNYTNCDTDRIFDGGWVRWDGSVTHWMPLPKPPKGV